MERRGLTLLELLIVVGLILAIAALVFPVMTDRLAERRFDSAAQQVRAHMLLARAEAMSTRRAVEVRYAPDRRVVETVRFEPEVDEAGMGVRQRAAARSEDSGGDPLTEALGPIDGEEIGRTDVAVVDVPESVRILDRLPEDLDVDLEAGMALDLDAEQLEYLEAESPEMAVDDPFAFEERPAVRLAVYLGDGSALLSKPLWLIDEDGRRAKLEVNPWTGVPRLTREAAASDAADDDEPDAEADDDFDTGSSDETPTTQRSRREDRSNSEHDDTGSMEEDDDS